jgi:hypothetical protein
LTSSIDEVSEEEEEEDDLDLEQPEASFSGENSILVRIEENPMLFS